MECTPEQIEEKRRIALAKLHARKLQFNQSVSNNLKNNVLNQTFKPESPGSSSYQAKMLSDSSIKAYNNTPYSKPVSPQKFFGKIVTGTMALISENRFEVCLSDFNEKAIQIFKTIPSRVYDLKTKNWNFDMKDYTVVGNKLQSLKPEVVVGRLPTYLVKLLNENKYDSHIDLSRIDGLLLATLLPFQMEGVIYGINRNGRLLIADDMGLGKTFQALAIANYYKQNWPLLIVTTASMR